MRPNLLLLLLLAVAYAPNLGAQAITCLAKSYERPVRSTGNMEKVSDILIECRDSLPTPAPAPGQVTLQVTLNVNVGNTAVTQGSNAVNAVAIVNGNNCGSPSLGAPTFGTCGAPNPIVQDPQYALPSSANRLQWLIDLPAPSVSPGQVSTILLRGIRGNATLLGINGGPLTAFIASSVGISNNVLIVARSSNRPLPVLGVYSGGSWFLDRNGDDVFNAAAEVSGWGSGGDTPVRGDWNGDGVLDLGVFSGGIWFIDATGNNAFDAASDIKGWGVAGWIPVTGDWNGDGKTDLGAVNPANMTWFRDMNGDFACNPATELAGWGSPGVTPVVGDWNGDGKDDLGVFSGGIWFIDANGNQAFDPASDIFGWGVAGWTPVVGDWNGDGKDDLGAIDPATFNWFRDMNGDKAFDASKEVVMWGTPGNTPVVVDWDADGDDDLGVFSGGDWFIDINGNQTFEPVGEIKSWGVGGWSLVPGVWR